MLRGHVPTAALCRHGSAGSGSWEQGLQEKRGATATGHAGHFPQGPAKTRRPGAAGETSVHRCCKVPLGRSAPRTDLWPGKGQPWHQSHLKTLSRPQHPWSLQHPGRLPVVFWPGGLPEHLDVFALHSSPPRPLAVCAVSWLRPAGGKPQPGQHQAPARGHAHRCKPGEQLCTPVSPSCPVRSPSPAAPFLALACSPGQRELCHQRRWLPGPSPSVGLSLRREASPKAKPRPLG